MFSHYKVIELMESKGWTPYRLSKESGLSTSVVLGIVNGTKKTPSADTVFKISVALGVPIDYLFEESSINDDLKEILPKLDKLSKEDKKMILSMINRLNI